MPKPFDSGRIVALGWCQGAVLGETLSLRAAEHAPTAAPNCPSDSLIVTSHDCDITNPSLDKEPTIEVLRGRESTTKDSAKVLIGGRNPRRLQFDAVAADRPLTISCAVHERWFVPRELLLCEEPAWCIPHKERRLIAEWLAKRYIRSAFPTAFDIRWRAKQRAWLKILKAHSAWIRGAYLRLSTLVELSAEAPYEVHLILAAPPSKRRQADWPAIRDEIEEAVGTFWSQVHPAIHCAGVEVLGLDEITLSEIEMYQRLDADWVSYDDETSTTPLTTDLSL